MVYCEQCIYRILDYYYNQELWLWQWKISCKLDNTKKKEGDFCNKYNEKIYRIKM